ncbi:MAG: hypothetical protein MK209_04055 [Planctomycetes bacterium]|nr:hypothetical protein [Planctomycetota bacterium]
MREEILLQDLRRESWQPDTLLRHYDRRYQASGDAVSTLLLARVTEEVRFRRRLLDEAKKSDPDLLQVRVEILANEPFRVGDEVVLRRLLRLLNRDPGLAEGWRLLRELGPRYGSPDLACTAADLEPWCPGEDLTAAHLDQVRARLEAGRARRALAKLDSNGLNGRTANLLRASALAELERAPEAWELLRRMQETYPEDPVISFDLGLLARDYLGQPERASLEFNHFLELVAEAQARGQDVDEFRILQAKTWLWQRRAESIQAEGAAVEGAAGTGQDS